MNIVACRDRKQSPNAMWRAYLAVTVLTDPNNTQKSPAIVGHAFLNARYYDSQREQFLSDDPVFWSAKQVLENPQSLNSYTYANGNPITGKDPTGLQCVYCAGGEVGLSLTAQATFDKTFGQSSSAVYGGDVVASALYGFDYPWTLVAPEPIAAACGR